MKHTAMRLSVAIIIKGDRPRARLGSSTDQLGLRYRRRIRMVVFLPVRNLRIQIMLTAWERMVARAAPRTPISSPKIKMGSRMMLQTAPMRTVSILVTVKPWALIKVFRPSVTRTKRVPREYSRRYSKPYSSVLSVPPVPSLAPKASSMGSAKM